jgi:hypothetical protein
MLINLADGFKKMTELEASTKAQNGMRTTLLCRLSVVRPLRSLRLDIQDDAAFTNAVSFIYFGRWVCNRSTVIQD